jgi:hypothetical protein
LQKNDKAKGVTENAKARKKGGAVVKNARLELVEKNSEKYKYERKFLWDTKGKLNI